MRASDENKPGTVAYLRFANQNQEARAIARIIISRLAAGVPAQKVAILARSSVANWKRSIDWALNEYGIAVASDSWVTEALSDRELRRIRAMALLALNEDDSLAWMTLLHLMPNVGPTTLDRIYAMARPGERFVDAARRGMNEGFPGIGDAQLNRLRPAFSDVLTALQSEGWTIPDIPPMEGWGAWLAAKAANPLGENARRLLDLVGRKTDSANGLGVFLAQMEPLGKDFALSEQDAVRFMTMYSSKGLTMDTVVVIGVEDGNIPMPPPRGDPGEERRLLYVAMTRATDYCILTMCRQRRGPIAFAGMENLRARSRSPLLHGVLLPEDGEPWLEQNGV
jgi:DNA helicase-2/ATP-dependent DNA helicase PcrA